MDHDPKYLCPYCKREIATDDVNVSTDIALCRACDRTSSFSSLCDEGAISTADLNSPPKGIKIDRHFRGGQSIVYKKISKAVFFMVPFTAIWSGGSMWSIYGEQFRKGEFDLGTSLIGIPFLLGSIFLISSILIMLFGKWKINLQRGQGEVLVGIGFASWKRKFRYHSDTRVNLKMTGFKVNNVPQPGICVATDGKEINFGATLPEKVKGFIAAAILREIRNR